MDRSGKVELRELKLVLVGEGGVGKTSLASRLVESSFLPHVATTSGLEIRKWEVQVNGESVTLGIWDFGGQAVFHAAYQLFLTQRSLYLLVLNGRTGVRAESIEYWLKLIQTFAAKAPVIVVVTHSDQVTVEFDWFRLRRKYPSVRGAPRHVSNMTGEGVDGLRDLVVAELGRFDRLRIVIPRSWHRVKEMLETLEDDYITYSDYSECCLAAGIASSDEHAVVVRLLHDLGTLIYLDASSKLRDIVVLHPQWLLSAMTRILLDPSTHRNSGILDSRQLGELHLGGQVPQIASRFLLEVLVEIEFCVRDGQRYLVASSIPVTPPPFVWDEQAERIGFHYEYSFLPESLFIRLISRMYPHIRSQVYWKTGLVVEQGQSTALIIADVVDGRIDIHVAGPAGARQGLLAKIRTVFDQVHESVPGIAIEQKVSLPEYHGRTIDYPMARSLYELGERTIVPVGFSERIDLHELLVAIDGAEVIQEIRIAKEPVRVFLCHSSGDKPRVRELFDRLRADNVDTWLDEEALVPGEEWELEIQKAVRRSHAAVICLSQASVSKAGYVQKEIRYALDIADEQPEGAIYLIPVRLEECSVPSRLQRWQWVDLFRKGGYSRLLQALSKRARDLGLLRPGDSGEGGTPS